MNQRPPSPPREEPREDLSQSSKPPQLILPTADQLLPPSLPRRALMFASLLFVGFGVGWLLGLSTSPVVHIVISAVTGAIAAVVAAMSGVQGRAQWSVSPVPTAILVAGVLIGSLLGMKARIDDWLGRDVGIDMGREADAWIQAGLPLDRGTIVHRLFESQYPPPGSDAAPQPAPAPEIRTGLFGVSSDECRRMRGLMDDALRREVRVLTDERARRLAEIVPDAEVLQQIIEEVLCAAAP